MMVVVTILLTLLVYGESSAEICDTFHLTQAKVTFQNNYVYYRIGILKSEVADRYYFKVQVEPPGDGGGMPKVSVLLADQISEERGVYTFLLNKKGERKLEQKRYLPVSQHVYVPLKVHDASVTKLSIGENFECDAPIYRKPSVRKCIELSGKCPKAIMSRSGFSVVLDVTKLRTFHLKIGFASGVSALAVKEDSTIRKILFSKKECGILYHFLLLRNEQGPAKVSFIMENMTSVPEITFIRYGNIYCNGFCGTKPVCSTVPGTEDLDLEEAQGRGGKGDTENVRGKNWGKGEGSGEEGGKGPGSGEKGGKGPGSGEKGGKGPGSGEKGGKGPGSGEKGGKGPGSGMNEGKRPGSGMNEGKRRESGMNDGMELGSGMNDGMELGSGMNDGMELGSGMNDGMEPGSGMNDGMELGSGMKGKVFPGEKTGGKVFPGEKTGGNVLPGEKTGVEGEWLGKESGVNGEQPPEGLESMVDKQASVQLPDGRVATSLFGYLRDIQDDHW